MNKNQNNEKLKIKVNRVPSDTGISYPYSKYLKSNYPQMNKLSKKNPFLYKVKYKPEIIINEYHQTSNNINTNININKTNNNKKQNLNSSRNITNNFMDQKKNYSFNKSNEDYEYDKSIKGEDYNRDYSYINSNKSFNKGRQIRGSDFIPNKVNKSQKTLNENNNNNNGNENNIDIFSPFSNGYSIHSRDSEYKKRNLKRLEDMKHSHLNKYNKRSPNYIFQSPIDAKSNRNIQVSTDRSNFSNFMNSSHNYNDNENNNLFFNSRNGTNESISKQNSKSELNASSNALNYRKYNKRPSTNTYLYNKTTPDETESSIESLRKNNNKNNFNFSSSNHSNNNIGIRIKNNNSNYFKNKTYYNTSYNNDNNRDSLNIKLENYRIKLFKEFLKHFQSFYKAYIKKNFFFFLSKIRRYKKNSNKSFIYSRKNYLININNTIDNHNIHRKRQGSTLSFSHHYGGELINIKKTSTMKDYYRLYNQLKRNTNLNKSMNQINKIFNSYSFSNDSDDDSSNLININNSILANSGSNISQRRNKNLSTLSISQNRDNKTKYGLDPKSPTFQYATKTITNSDISFESQPPTNRVNELYRNSKELSKKYEQIQRRKRILKNRQNHKGITSNKSVDFYNFKKSDAYSQFNELRRYIQTIRKESNSKEKKEKFDRNVKNTNKNKTKRLIRINALDSNSNSEENENINENLNINLNLNKSYYNYHYNLNKFHKKEKDKEIDSENIIMRNSIEREGRTGMLRKKKEGFLFSKNYITQTNSNKNENINIIPDNKYYNLIRNKLYNNNNNSNINHSYDNNIGNNNDNNYDRLKVNTLINNSNMNNSNKDDNNYKKVKVNINKKFLMDNQEKNLKQRKNIINGANIDYDNNNKINNNNESIKTRLNPSPTNKNNTFYTKRNYNKYKNKGMPTLIKDISTKDNRIHIKINYYELNPKNKVHRKYYIFLVKSENISISLISDDNQKDCESNLNNKLSAIQEEEISVQNSKFYDENETFGINNNFINNNNINGNNINNINNNANNNLTSKVTNGKEGKKNYIIYHDNEIVYANIIESIIASVNSAYKRAFFNNLKTLCESIKENIIVKKNNNRIYSRKRGVNNNKISGDKYYSENVNNFKRKKYIKRNVNDRIYEEKLQKFRNKLIKYIFLFFKKKLKGL